MDGLLDRYVHAPDLTEVGNFSNLIDKADPFLRESEKRIETQFAFATTVPRQISAVNVLREAGWRDLGHRYNQFHGPNFITLWFKEFADRVKPAQPADYLEGWMGAVPPRGAFSCGIWVEAKPFGWSEKYLQTKYLSVWRQPNWEGTEEQKYLRGVALRENGWQLMGHSKLGGSIWHTAEPHTSENRYEAYDTQKYGVRGRVPVEGWVER
jgi:hypothetical protein